MTSTVSPAPSPCCSLQCGDSAELIRAIRPLVADAAVQLMGHVAPVREPLHWHLTTPADSAQPQPQALLAVHQFLERQLRQRHAAGWPDGSPREAPWLFSEELTRKPPIANSGTSAGAGTSAGTRGGEAAQVGPGSVAVAAQQVTVGPKAVQASPSKDRGTKESASQASPPRKQGARKGARNCVCVCGGRIGEERGVEGGASAQEERDFAGGADLQSLNSDGTTAKSLRTVVCKKCSRLNDYALLLRWHKARMRGGKACSKTSSLFRLLGTVSVIGAIISYVVTWIL